MSHNPQMWTPEWAAAARERWVDATTCPKCKGTGSIDTGNNDLPCDCPAGDTALFNVTGVEGGPITGAEDKRHFQNFSPEPLETPINVENIPGRQGRVLVVDDDAVNREIVTQWLNAVGYEVVVAQDGLQGLRTFHDDDKGFRLVLSDWSMPHMMGTEMLRKIRRASRGSQRLMMMSSDPLTPRRQLNDFHMNNVRVLDKTTMTPDEVQKAVKAAIEAKDAGATEEN